MRYWMPLFAVLSLTGCKTTDAAWAERDDAKCLSYGVQKGSPPYVECRLQLEKQRSDARIAAMASPATMVMNAGAEMSQAPRPQHCMWVGQVWTCH